MTLKGKLLAVSNVFAEAKGLSLSRVSTIVFGDGKVLGRLGGASDITTGRFEAGMRWFAINWPAEVAWPDGVERPAGELAE